MRLAIALAVPLLLAACAASPPAPEGEPAAEIHAEFRALRPVMVQVRVDGKNGAATSLARALYDRLIAKGYSVLAPGAPSGEEVGVFRAVLSGTQAAWSGKAVMEDPFGTVIYRSGANGSGDVSGLAHSLLKDLPPK